MAPMSVIHLLSASQRQKKMTKLYFAGENPTDRRSLGVDAVGRLSGREFFLRENLRDNVACGVILRVIFRGGELSGGNSQGASPPWNIPPEVILSRESSANCSAHPASSLTTMSSILFLHQLLIKKKILK